MSETPRLELQIRDNSAETIRALNNLAAALGRVSRAVDGNALGTVARSMENLSTALARSIPEENISRIERMATALEQLQRVSGNLGNLNLQNAVPQIGDTTAIQQAQQTAEGYAQSMRDAADAIVQLAQTARESGITQLASSLEEATAEARNFNNEISQDARESGLENTQHQREEIGNNADVQRLRQATEEAANAATHATNNYAGFANVMRGARGVFNSVANVLRRIGSGALQFAKSGVQALGSAFSNVARYGVQALGNTLSRMIRPVTNLTEKFGKLFNSFKRLATYRLLRAAIKKITEGVSEGVKNLYQYSLAINGTFAKAMDQGASASLKFKNSIGAMLGPVIEAAIPLLIQLANYAIAAANAINMFVSMLFGRDTWTHAKDVTAKAYDGLDKTAKSAKGASNKVKELLADFDELNIIQSESGGSGGSGSGTSADALSASDMFVTEKLPVNQWTNLAAEIKNAIAANDWDGLGKLLANKVNTVIGMLQPEAWAQKINNVFGNVLRTVNSFLANLKFEDIGAKFGAFFTEIFDGNNQVNWDLLGAFLARRIIGVIEFAKGIVTTPMLFTNFGKAMASVVNGLFTSITDQDVSTAAVTLGNLINGIVNTAKTFLKDVNFKSIGRKINHFINDVFGSEGQIKWDRIGQTFYDGLMSVFDFADGLFADPVTSGAKIGESIASVVNGFFSFTPTDLNQMGKSVTNAIRYVLALAYRFIKDVNWNDIGQQVADFIAGIDWKQLFIDVWNVINAAIEAAFELATPIGKTLGRMGYNAVVDLMNLLAEQTLGIEEPLFKKYSDNDSFYKAWEEGLLGSDVDTKLIAAAIVKLKAGWVMIENWWNTSGPGGWFKKIKESIAKAWDDIVTLVKIGAFNILNAIAPVWNDIAIKLNVAILAYKALTGSQIDIVPTIDIENIRKQWFGGQDVDDAVKEALGQGDDGIITLDPIDATLPIEAKPVITEQADEQDFGVAFELDTGDMGNLYDLIYDNLFDNSQVGYDAYEFMDNILSPIIDQLSSNYGLEDSNIATKVEKSIMGDLEKAIKNPDFWPQAAETIQQKITKIFEDALGKEKSSIKVPPPDTSDIDAGLKSTEENVRAFVNNIRSAFRGLAGLSFSFTGGMWGGGFNVNFPAFAAEGGIFGMGEMFIAREAGPELVGRIGNKTGVANNDQIIQGIAGGVAAGQEQQTSLLRQQNAILMQLLNKKFTAEVRPTTALGRVNDQSERMYERISG